MNYLHIVNKVAIKEKTLFVLLQISLLVLSFIFLVVYFLINGIQKIQFDAIRNVRSFDVRIYLDDNKGVSDIEDIRAINGIEDVFLVSEIKLFSTTDNKEIILKMVSDNLFTNKRFNSQFMFFNPPLSAGISASTMTSLSPFVEYYYIKKSTFNRAMLTKTKLLITSYFYSQSPVCENVAFSSIDNQLFDYGDKYFAIYATSQKKLEKSLNAKNIIFKTYRDYDTTLTTALHIERYLFMFALFCIFIVLVILLYRLMLRSIFENAKNIKTFLILGLIEKKVYVLFTIPMFIASIVSISLGCSGAIVVAKKKVFDSIFKQLFGEINLFADLKFSFFYILVCLLFMILFSLLLIIKCKKIKQVDYYE